MGDIIKLVLSLTLISAISGLAIGMANEKTADKIAEQQRAARESAIEVVLPAGVKINEMKDKAGMPEKYWTAFAGDKLVAYAFEMSGNGYAGDIKFMVGVGTDGKIIGMTVLEHDETPGLGSRVNEVPSSKYIWYPVGGDNKAKPWFTEQFEGLSCLKPMGIDKNAGEWHKLDQQAKTSLRDKNAVTAITGSTITTVAFTRAIEQKVSAYIKELGGYCCPEVRKKNESAQGADVAGELPSNLKSADGPNEDDKKLSEPIAEAMKK